MRLRLATAALLMVSAAWPAGAQQAPPSPPPPVPCKDHTVDEYLAEMHKRKRNKNPLPSNTCILGWCRQTPEPGEVPPLPPRSPQEPDKTPSGQSSSQAGSAGTSQDLRGTSLYDPIKGARNVEAGDYYFEKQNYRAALSRYQEALQDKPDDPAIHLRLGRACEKLDDAPAAYEHYDASLILAPQGPTARPVQEGLERLRPQLAKAGADASAIHAHNAEAIAASCPREGSKP